MSRTAKKTLDRQQRHHRVRARVIGTTERPRLCVYRSLSATYAQIIDDTTSQTLVAAHDLKDTKGTKVERATQVGTRIAELAQAKKITAVVFDRGGYQYHGRVQAVADAARAAGLQF